MERKRKLPARGARAEGPSKKRTSTTPDQQTQSPTPAVPPTVVEEPLPKHIAPGKPLPTVTEPQPENLPSSHFQSIPESGVLPESLNRSRQKWISEGIFEKYWTKVTKKKGAPELPKDNPPKDSMTKLGTCTITVEPHIFEATMFAIKDTTPRPIPQSMQRPPILQYGPPGGMMPPPPTPPPVQVKPIPPPQSTPQPSPKAQDVHMSGTSPATHNPPPPPANGVTPTGFSARPQPPPPNPLSRYPTHAMAAGSGPPAPPPAPANSSRTDPVIQMLAERAATDPDLKGLMRIVANGEASTDELKKFQSHIDELTKLQKARQAVEAPQPVPVVSQPPPPPPPSAVPAPSPQVNGSSSHQTGPPPQPPSTTKSDTAAPIQAAPTPPHPPPAVAPAPQFQAPQPQALRSKGPLPPSKPDISGVVFEFTGGNGDRYLFPKFSVLEYPPGSSQVIASFLIIRKGSASDSPTYDPVLDYYQPITIRLYAHQGRQLEALQKVVAPPDEVRRYMDDVMEKCTRAEYVLLAMRLPRDPDQPPVTEVEDDASKAQRMEGIQVNWVTTNAPPPPQPAKPVQRLLTEEEKYQSYIGTVAAAS